MGQSNGLDSILKNLQLVRESTQKKIVKKALRKGAVPIRDQAKQNARNIDDPETKEKIWRNIRIQQKKKLPKGEFGVGVGVAGGGKSGGKGPGLDTYYWWFKEFGTSTVAADPFMRTAFESKKAESEQIVAQEMMSGIYQELIK